MNGDQQLYTFLEDHSIQFDYYEHLPLFTVEDSEKYGVDIPGAHTKNLFLTDKKGGYYLLSVVGSKRVPVNQFRKQLGVKDLSFGSPEELYSCLQLTPGSVSMLGLFYGKEKVKCYLDKDLWEAEKVGVHPNSNDATLVIEHNELVRLFELWGVEVHVVEVPQMV